MMQILYLLGAPGSGKTTLMQRLLQGRDGTQIKQPVQHIRYSEALCQLGALREMFGGTDALPLNVQPAAITWLSSQPYPYVIAEGARLGNPKFLTACRAFATVHVLYMNTPDALCHQRRVARGHTFNAAFVKGASTRALNTARQFIQEGRWYLDGSLSPDEIYTTLHDHPFIQQMNTNL